MIKISNKAIEIEGRSEDLVAELTCGIITIKEVLANSDDADCLNFINRCLTLAIMCTSKDEFLELADRWGSNNE